MKTISLIVIIACVWAVVLGQYQGSIRFKTSTEVPKPTLIIVNEDSENCKCVLSGTCLADRPHGLQPRSLIAVPKPPSCPTGYTRCCTSETNFNPNLNPPVEDTTCGIRKIPTIPQGKIGQASFGAYPWQAAILNQQQYLVGSGVLLDATHVLTTAHNVYEFANNPQGLLVRLGEWDAQSHREPYQYVQKTATKVTMHPNYVSGRLGNDVAVVELSSPVPINNYPNINTACKPSAAPSVGKRCYISGWGKNLFGPTGAFQSILREVDVPIVQSTDCENRLRRTSLGATFRLDKYSFICAGGEPGKDACEGDGGSALVCQKSSGQWEVVGLVAWGVGCAELGVPGVYTNVPNFMPWINSVVGAGVINERPSVDQLLRRVKSNV